jgi:hypothetical protein
MRGNLPGPEGLARPFARAQPLYHGGPTDPCDGASAALHGLPVVTTTGGAARLASAPSHYPMARAKPNCIARIYGLANAGSREILRQAPGIVSGRDAIGCRPD